MDADDADRVLPFQLQFDKPIASNIKIAEWNPEKDLLAMVTEDSKIVLHRFNWQRLWNVSPGRTITSLCWRPDGKAVAVGLEDGTISLHDVENGKLLRSVKSHTVAVVCLHWEEDRQLVKNEYKNSSTYEDRTPRFFPPAPSVPRIPGLVSGDTGFMNDDEDSYLELSNSPQQRFNILCSGDKDGSISFNIFGIFPIGKVNIHELDVPIQVMGTQVTYRLLHASICKVSLSNDLCRLTVMCFGDAVEDSGESRNIQKANYDVRGMHSLVLDTSIFWTRKNELHQVAQQASNIEELIQVIRASLSVMSKQWSDAMHTFHEKFNPLAKLIIDHGLDSSPQEEFLSLLGGARTSPPVHQFLVNSLGEAGVKRVSKVICGTGKDLQLIVLDHLQPAAEIIGFRMGELRGLSRWRARYLSIGLDENLMSDATENAGMLLVQVERFMRVLSSLVQQFSNFFNWLLKCIKMLMTEPSDQLPPSNSELVVLFLKFLYDQDPVRKLLEESEANNDIEIDVDMMQRLKEMALFGGFTDCEHLRTLAKEFRQMESRFEKAFLMPFTTISRKIYCEDLLPLFPLRSSPTFASSNVPLSISYFEEDSQAVTALQNSQQKFFNYISFRISEGSFSGITNCIGVARGCMHGLGCTKKGYTSFEAVLLSVPSGYHCVDLSLYKDKQLVVLLNGTANDSESSGYSCMMIAQLSSLPFASISLSTSSETWKLHQLKDYVVHLKMENEKFRSIPCSVVAPLAVSASRGVACVFAAKKRALVYILEEDEDQASDTD